MEPVEAIDQPRLGPTVRPPPLPMDNGGLIAKGLLAILALSIVLGARPALATWWPQLRQVNETCTIDRGDQLIVQRAGDGDVGR